MHVTYLHSKVHKLNKTGDRIFLINLFWSVSCFISFARNLTLCFDRKIKILWGRLIFFLKRKVAGSLFFWQISNKIKPNKASSDWSKSTSRLNVRSHRIKSERASEGFRNLSHLKTKKEQGREAKVHKNVSWSPYIVFQNGKK